MVSHTIYEVNSFTGVVFTSKRAVPPADARLFAMKNDFLTAQHILNSIADGVYVTDLDRKIIYWNQAAETITGWRGRDVLGHACRDGILCHVDKHERSLCDQDTCPLYRAITTGRAAQTPIVVYAKHRQGRRIPMKVNVDPVHDDNGEIVGGVEVFRDMSDSMEDQERAKNIQHQRLKFRLDPDAALHAAVHYIPHDILGGDYYAVEQLSRHLYAFLLADVMGHGTSAALYTMYLRTLFDDYRHLFPDVTAFISRLNQQLHNLMRKSFSFAAAVCGVIDTQRQSVTLTGGAHPGAFIFHRDGLVKTVQIPGFALGMVKQADYRAQTFPFEPGDLLFLYTDGAIENCDRHGRALGEAGLQYILQQIGYPGCQARHQTIEAKIIEHAASVGLQDDLTLLEFYRPLSSDECYLKKIQPANKGINGNRP